MKTSTFREINDLTCKYGVSNNTKTNWDTSVSALALFNVIFPENASNNGENTAKEVAAVIYLFRLYCIVRFNEKME